MPNKQISIIAPIYNIPIKYFKESLDSLVNQTIKDKIEIILIDDGSTNGCAKICDEYSTMYKDIKVIHQKNQGVSMARNAGIEIAKGKWIMFVDPDDWVEKNICEELLKYDKDDIDIILTSCNECYKNKKIKVQTFDEDYKEINRNEREMLQIQLISSEVLGKKVRHARYLGTPWAKLYRASFIRENKLKFEKCLYRGEDVIFNLYSFEKARKILYTKSFLYNYRKYVGALTNKHDKNLINHYFKFSEEELKFIKKFNKTNIFYEAYYIRTLKFVSELINQYCFGKNIVSYKEGKKVLKNILEIEDINNALYKINTKNLSLYKRCLLMALKVQNYFLISLIARIRYIIKAIYGLNEKNMYDAHKNYNNE